MLLYCSQSRAGVVEWQTRWTQNPLLVTTCGFKSHHLHQTRYSVECLVFLFSALPLWWNTRIRSWRSLRSAEGRQGWTQNPLLVTTLRAYVPPPAPNKILSRVSCFFIFCPYFQSLRRTSCATSLYTREAIEIATLTLAMTSEALAMTGGEWRLPRLRSQ